MKHSLTLLLAALCASTITLAKPAGKTNDDVVFQSPGKPSHPLQLSVDVDASRLQTGVASEGRMVVRSAVPVENLQVVLRPSSGMQVLSDGALERSVSSLPAEESLAMPLRLEPAADDARRFVVELRAMDPSGRVISREVSVNLDAASQPRRKSSADGAADRKPGEDDAADAAIVRAKQEIIRGD